jgi:hypothetical protein
MAWPWIGRKTRMEDTTRFSAKLRKLGAEYGKAATSSRGCTGFAFEPVVSQPIAQMTRMLILRGGDHLQFLFNHYKSSGHHRAVPRHQPLCRQPTANARRIPGLPGASDPQHRGRSRDGHDALGYAATTQVSLATSH